MTATRPSAFGTLLRRYRLAAGLTHEQLAERSGLSARGISDLERGLRLRPHKDTVFLIAAALQLGQPQRAALSAATGHSALLDSSERAIPPSPSVEAGSDHRRLISNIPQALTSFIGRAHEIAEVKRLVSTSRLVTLIGAGGCGKTRLALRVASDLLAALPDGVWMVELASLTEENSVPRSVLLAMGVREAPERSAAATLTEYLRARSLLLVLDNCEHLVRACARLVAELLRACPDLRILATSRETLAVEGEMTWRVPSMSVPEVAVTLSPDCLVRFEAVQLFVERAQAAEPSFNLTESNAAAVAQICRQLDGIPLAIE